MPRILVVDDDLQFRRTLCLALDSLGFEVDAAADGKDALDSISFHAPDLVVLDWHLPYLDGIQICRELRTHSAVPVIMISGDRSNSRDAALSAGAAEYLTKPFSIGDLLAVIESALNR